MSNSVSDFGKDLGLVHEAIVTGRKVGAGHEFWATLAHNEKMFRKVVNLAADRPSYNVVVNCNRFRSEMIKAGNYDWVDENITGEHFPVESRLERQKDIVLFHFNKSIETYNVVAALIKAGYRPANADELLALGENYPDLQREFSIVALGSVWLDTLCFHNVLYLSTAGHERNLGLITPDDGWDAAVRFAAVLK